MLNLFLTTLAYRVAEKLFLTKRSFITIDPDTYNMNPDLLEDAITEHTRAIIPVHLYGQMADMDPIMRVADEHGLVVIEDAAQAIGAEYKGRRAG